MSENRSEIIALYEHCGREIAFIKSRQWYATYYSLLGNAALVAVRHQVVPVDASMWTSGLVVAATIVFAITLNYLVQCGNDTVKNKETMLKCHRHFGQAFRDAAGPGHPGTSTPKAVYAIVGGAFFLTYLLLLTSPREG